MPFALITVGLLLVVSGVRNTTQQLSQQVAKDFSGSDSFLYWLAGLIAVGALGYIDALRTFSRLLLALIIVVMALSNKGFFAQFQAALSGASAPAPASTDPSTGTTQGSATPNGSGSNGSTTEPHAPGLFEFNPSNDFNYLYKQFQSGGFFGGNTAPGAGTSGGGATGAN